jgi:hypothetical protein
MPLILTQVADEKFLNAINVSQAVVSGWLFGAVVYNQTTGEDFIYSEKSGRDPFPVVIPSGHGVQVSVSAENTGDANQEQWLTVELIDPDGIVRATRTAHASSVSPESVMSSGNTPTVVLDKAGLWQIHGVLEAEIA